MPHPRPDASPRSSPPCAPPRILLLCSEALGPQICCVEDALRARGYDVWVEQGRRARQWVRTVPPGRPTMRVLCIPTIDPLHTQRLCEGRPDFHIVGLTTPHAVVEEIERLVGRHRSVRPRRSRTILAHPTLMEQSLHADRRLGRSLAMAGGAVALVALGGMLGVWAGTEAPRAPQAPSAPAFAAGPRPSEGEAGLRARRTPIDRTVLSTVAAP